MCHGIQNQWQITANSLVALTLHTWPKRHISRNKALANNSADLLQLSRTWLPPLEIHGKSADSFADSFLVKHRSSSVHTHPHTKMLLSHCSNLHHVFFHSFTLYTPSPCSEFSHTALNYAGAERWEPTPMGKQEQSNAERCELGTAWKWKVANKHRQLRIDNWAYIVYFIHSGQCQTLCHGNSSAMPRWALHACTILYKHNRRPLTVCGVFATWQISGTFLKNLVQILRRWCMNLSCYVKPPQQKQTSHDNIGMILRPFGMILGFHVFLLNKNPWGPNIGAGMIRGACCRPVRMCWSLGRSRDASPRTIDRYVNTQKKWMMNMIWLVVGPPLWKNMSSSIGMMRFPIFLGK